MSSQRSFWVRWPLIKQLKWVKVGHGEVTINNADTVYVSVYLIFIFLTIRHFQD